MTAGMGGQNIATMLKYKYKSLTSGIKRWNQNQKYAI